MLFRCVLPSGCPSAPVEKMRNSFKSAGMGFCDNVCPSRCCPESIHPGLPLVMLANRAFSSRGWWKNFSAASYTRWRKSTATPCPVIRHSPDRWNALDIACTAAARASCAFALPSLAKLVQPLTSTIETASAVVDDAGLTRDGRWERTSAGHTAQACD